MSNKEQLRNMIIDLDLSEFTKTKLIDKVDLVGEELFELRDIIDKAIEYIENHYEDRSFDEIHDEMLKVLKGEE